MKSEVGFADVKFKKAPIHEWVMVDHYMKEYGRRRVIDPRALQEEFRKAIDEVLKVIKLPEHWRHGEKCLLDEFPKGSFVKTLIRVSKILRVEYLKMPEHRKKRKGSDGERPFDQQPANCQADPSNIQEMTRERLQDVEIGFVESKDGEN
ncbi:hypothetical protein LSH36_649g00041 [Paralvinella palmiformis]|uniref:Uncharacterized protein n=1 Tax=Paralvinella palmiformis TaxID=53620 RepID=A0AAD9MVZ5_9ANNE|nr:hypothetical protein LSH36_649g00041 [Paralvinella palmiformis]